MSPLSSVSIVIEDLDVQKMSSVTTVEGGGG